MTHMHKMHHADTGMIVQGNGIKPLLTIASMHLHRGGKRARNGVVASHSKALYTHTHTHTHNTHTHTNTHTQNTHTHTNTHTNAHNKTSSNATGIDPSLIAYLRQDGEGKEYTMEGVLGKGKFSVVYKARYKGQLYAIKKVQVCVLYVCCVYMYVVFCVCDIVRVKVFLLYE